MRSLTEPKTHLVHRPVSPGEVQDCLNAILSSGGFRKSARLARFLKYLVNQALDRDGAPKEYEIGVEVFDRGNTYDPRIDPIVRVEARRLRLKLADYYRREGSSNPILIEMPARGYLPSFRVRGVTTLSAGAETFTACPISLVVLPLASLEVHANFRNLVEALTDEIAALLASLPGLRVVARTSALRFRDRPEDVREIGARLDADYVLEGSVRKQKRRIRVLVQIASSTSGFRVWSGSYEEDLESTFDAEAGLARRIVADLGDNISALNIGRPGEQSVLALYQKGRRYLNSRTDSGIRRSIECFQQVIERDATFALAYAGLADSYSLGARYDVLPPQDSWRKARSAALDAIRIDCSLPEAHTSFGFIELHYARSTSDAEREFCTAIQLNPRYAPARQWYAWCLIASGRAEEGIRNIKLALELDPLSPNARADLALAYYFSRQYRDSIAECLRTLQFSPGFYRTHQLLGLNFLQTGEYSKAIEQFQFATGSSGRNTRLSVLLSLAHARLGQVAEATRLAGELSAAQHVAAIDFALVYGALGAHEQAFHYLEQAFLDNEGELIWMSVDPIYDALRGDPRFGRLLERIAVGPNGRVELTAQNEDSPKVRTITTQ